MRIALTALTPRGPADVIVSGDDGATAGQVAEALAEAFVPKEHLASVIMHPSAAAAGARLAARGPVLWAGGQQVPPDTPGRPRAAGRGRGHHARGRLGRHLARRARRRGRTPGHRRPRRRHGAPARPRRHHARAPGPPARCGCSRPGCPRTRPRSPSPGALSVPSLEPAGRARAAPARREAGRTRRAPGRSAACCASPPRCCS